MFRPAEQGVCLARDSSAGMMACFVTAHYRLEIGLGLTQETLPFVLAKLEFAE